MERGGEMRREGVELIYTDDHLVGSQTSGGTVQGEKN